MTTLGAIFPPAPAARTAAARRPRGRGGRPRAAVGVGGLLLRERHRRRGRRTGLDGAVGVGIGLLPVPLRNVALTAMEIATLDRLFPGRLVPGVGHGVLDWMGQVGRPGRVADDAAARVLDRAAGAAARRDGDRRRAATCSWTQVALDWPPQPAAAAADRGRAREDARAGGGARRRRHPDRRDHARGADARRWPRSLPAGAGVRARPLRRRRVRVVEGRARRRRGRRPGGRARGRRRDARHPACSSAHGRRLESLERLRAPMLRRPIEVRPAVDRLKPRPSDAATIWSRQAGCCGRGVARPGTWHTVARFEHSGPGPPGADD